MSKMWRDYNCWNCWPLTQSKYLERKKKEKTPPKDEEILRESLDSKRTELIQDWISVFIRALNQDGGVEGHALTPSCESTRIATGCWTIIDRKTLDFTKEGTPRPRTEEKPQWDGRRGAIRVKSNPITAGWVTHRLANTYATEVHPLEWRLWAPRQASQPGGPATGGGIPRESDFEV